MPARKKAAIPPPPVDLAARCRATIPVAADADFGRLRKPPRRRLLTATVGAAMLATLAVVDLARPSRTPHAVPSPNSGVAFAETVRAMQRVTYFHRTGTGFNVRSEPQWKYLTTRFTNDEWFDAQHGLYEQTRGSSSIVHDDGALHDAATLTLPNEQLYIRFGGEVWINDHSQRPLWNKVKKSKIREITNPSSFGLGIGSGLRQADVIPAAPSACRLSSWHGRQAIRFTFLAPPAQEKVDLHQDAAERAGNHEVWKLLVPKDSPTLRSEVYVDPDTRRVLAVQKYARFPAPSTQPELPICEYTYDYDHRPGIDLFSPNAILNGAKKVRDFRASHGRFKHIVTLPRSK